MNDAIYQVHPVLHPLDALVVVPGSKSIANRALICAALADGESVLHNVPGGDDTAAMLDCVALLGAGVGIDQHDETLVRVHGTGGSLHPGPLALDTRLAGTTSRFITALCALGSGHYVIDGLPPLRGRPMAPLHDALRSLGASVVPGESWGHLPVTIGGIDTAAEASGVPPMSVVAIRGDVSSQYITALMLIAPYLRGGLAIELTSPLVSRPYVGITAAVMASFGVHEIAIDDRAVRVGPGRYRACDFVIEPDASSAGYPLAAAAICGGTVRVRDLGADALQGDAAFADVLAGMGCEVQRDTSGTMVRRTGPLRGISLDMADMSDLVPTLAVVAPFADSATEITGIGFIRAKESDRLGDLAAELTTCGVRVHVLEDGLRIEPGIGRGGALHTHHDHRLAMAFGILGLGVPGVRIHDPDVVSKSWPGFWTALESLTTTTAHASPPPPPPHTEDDR